MKQSTPESGAEREAEPKEELPGPTRRPLSVTIASWVLIIWPLTIFAIYIPLVILGLSGPKGLKGALPPHSFGLVASMLIILWFGIGMRRGLRWTWLVWLWVGPVGIVSAYLNEPDQAVYSLTIYVIYALILNTRAARLYFTRGGFF